MKTKTLFNYSDRRLPILKSLVGLIAAGVLYQGIAAAQAITLAPATGSVTPLQTLALSASVRGTTNTGVKWSLSPNVGTLSTGGATAVYAAPSTISSPETVTVTATSMANSTKIASAVISLIPLVSLAVTPQSANLDPAGTQQFKATVTGAANTAVTWSLDQPVGSVSSKGLYTAPSDVPATQTVNLLAQSIADPSKVVRIPIILPGLKGVQFTLSSTGLSTLSYNGESMLYTTGHSTPYFVQVSQTDSSGNTAAASTTASSMVANTTANTLTATYPWGIATTAYQAIANKLLITVTIKNTTVDKTISQFWMFPVGLQFPETPTNQNNTNTAAFNIDAPSSIWWNYGSGSVDLVNEDVIKPLLSGFWQATNPPGPQWYLMLDVDPNHALNPNYPPVTRPIPPGNSDTYKVSLRFGGLGSTEPTLAGDIFSLYATAFPKQIQAPVQRKPIAALMVTAKQRPTFPTNPRGWFNDPKVDVTTSAGVATFQSRLLNWADDAVAEMTRVGAQGGILWDMEGQQFDESYIGDPTQLEALAPELVGVLDAFIAKFTSAGFRFGFTLRPQDFTQKTGFVNVSGTTLTWAGGTQFSPAWAATVDAGTIVIRGYNYKIHSVQSPTALTLATAPGNGSGVPYIYAQQSNTSNPEGVLQAKAQYAINRWGASLFYVDSDEDWYHTATSAADFQNLLNVFPKALFFPEISNARHYAYSLPYLDSRNGFTQPSADASYVYPNAAGLVNVGGNSDIQASYNALAHAVSEGTILLFDGWYTNPQNDAVMQIYAAASQ